MDLSHRHAIELHSWHGQNAHQHSIFLLEISRWWSFYVKCKMLPLHITNRTFYFSGIPLRPSFRLLSNCHLWQHRARTEIETIWPLIESCLLSIMRLLFFDPTYGEPDFRTLYVFLSIGRSTLNKRFLYLWLPLLASCRNAVAYLLLHVWNDT